MASMADKLREAQKTYRRIAEAVAALEAASEAASQALRGLREERQAAAREARQQREAVRQEIEAALWALRRPLRVLVVWGVAAAFLGAALSRMAQRCVDWLLGLAAGWIG